MGETIVVVSGKGGVGKTVISANIGAALAQKGKRVVLMDMDIGLRNLDISLGMENKIVYDMVDVIEGVCRIRQALIKDKRFPELYLMSSPQLNDKMVVTPTHIKVLCKKLKESFDYIILDAPAGINEGFINAVSAADSAILVTVPEYAAIRDAERVKKALEHFSIERKMLVINKVKLNLIKKGILPSIEYVVEALKWDLVGILPDDENIYIAANNGMPIALKKGSYIENNFSKIAERVMLQLATNR